MVDRATKPERYHGVQVGSSGDGLNRALIECSNLVVIDELRAEIARLVLQLPEQLRPLAQENRELRAEVERLGAALEKHHSQMRLADGDWGEPWTCGTCQMRT